MPCGSEEYLEKMVASGIHFDNAEKLQSMLNCLSCIYRAAVRCQPSMRDFGKRIRKLCPEASDELLQVLAGLWEKEGGTARDEVAVKVNHLVDVQWRLSVPLATSKSQSVFMNKPMVTLGLTTQSGTDPLTHTTLELPYASFLELSRSMGELSDAMKAVEAKS